METDRIELDAAVEAEVLRLPEKYRAVVVLCYWEGLTHEQVADRLGCPLGTVRSRVARARSLLHRRLSRRGLEPVAGIMSAALDSNAALSARSLEIPATLVSTTVQLAKQVAAGGSLAQLTSPSIAALVQSVIGRMFMTKLKTIAVYVALISAGALGLTLAAAQGERARRNQKADGQRQVASKSKAQPPLESMREYVVEPPDLLMVKVLDALPGRPIWGEILVRPDGKISLGFYGDVYVAGLTLSEIKVKIIRKLQQYLTDETLGLIACSDETGEPLSDANGKPKRIDPKDSDRISVDVTAYNSKNYYVTGEVSVPGKLPITGQERILDVINYAGGLTRDADHEQVFLYRPSASGGEPVQTKIDIDQILMGDDLSTNIQVFPGDRIVVRRRRDGVRPAKDDEGRQESEPKSKTAGPNALFNRLEVVPPPSTEGTELTMDALQRLGVRMKEMERKLDEILEAVKKPAR